MVALALTESTQFEYDLTTKKLSHTHT